MLFLFPFAGGTSLIYNEWKFRDSSKVHALDYKGHGLRMKEPLDASFESLVFDMKAQIEVRAGTEEPVVLFGHSMGALAAWDTARMLIEDGITINTVVLSSCVPPHHFDETKYVEMDSEEWLFSFMKKFNRVLGMRMESAFFREKIFPAIKNDYHLLSLHRHEEKYIAPFDIICLYGIDDELMPSKNMPKWAECTSGKFAIRGFQGNHFYIENEDVRKEIVAMIEEIFV